MSTTARTQATPSLLRTPVLPAPLRPVSVCLGELLVDPTCFDRLGCLSRGAFRALAGPAIVCIGWVCGLNIAVSR